MWSLRALGRALPAASRRGPAAAGAAARRAAGTEATPAQGLGAFFEPTEAVKKGEAPKFVKTGRSWRADELRTHTFDDLHKLWYVLLRERNLLVTDKLEARRQQRPFDHKRLHKVKRSMARLKFVVHERSRAFKAARAELEASAVAGANEPVAVAPGIRKAVSAPATAPTPVSV